jgi:hypothetical protein
VIARAVTSHRQAAAAPRPSGGSQGREGDVTMVNSLAARPTVRRPGRRPSRSDPALASIITPRIARAADPVPGSRAPVGALLRTRRARARMVGIAIPDRSEAAWALEAGQLDSPRIIRPTGHRVGHRLMVVLAASLVVGALDVAGGRAATASASRSPSSLEGHHRCKCFTSCRGTRCCCKSSDPPPTRAERPSPVASNRLSWPETAPCVGAAPCRGDERPGPAGPRTFHQSAAPAVSMIPLGPPGGSLLAMASTVLHPSLLTARLDEPPEPAVPT